MKYLKLILAGVILLSSFSIGAEQEIVPEKVEAQTSYKVRPIYLYPSDFPYKQEYFDALKDGIAQIQAWYMKSTGGFTFDYYPPVALKATKDMAWFKCIDGGCDGGVNYEESVNWGRVYYELGANGYWSCGSDINLVIMDGAGGFAGGGWCGSKNSGGQALVGTWTYQAHLGDYKCRDYFECNTGAAWGAAAHELGHVFGLPHTFDFDPSCASVMGQHWDFPKVGLCGSSLADEISWVKSLNYFSDKRVSGDAIPPVVSLTSPINGSTVSGYIPLTATASDNNKLQRVEYYVDDQLYAMNSLTFTNHIYPTLAKANGAHTFYAKAYDWGGNSTTTPTATVTISNSVPSDSQAPTTSITAPADNSTVKDLTDFRASVNDSNSGVDQVYFNHQWQISDTKTASGNGSYSSQIDFADHYAGKHTLNLRVTDKAGNISPYVNIHVTNDKTPPKPGDVDRDGDVDIFDLSALISLWKTSEERADFNNNGTVDIYDLSILLANWGV